MTTQVLLLPGYQNSSENHWQSLWERSHPNVLRVVQSDWENPICAQWYATLVQHIVNHDGDIVIAAHSLGCLLTAELARRAPAEVLAKVKGALLVAPPDPDGKCFPQSAQGFSPSVRTPLPFPTLVIASDNDVYGSIDYAQHCAAQWGSTLINIGSKGHINSESGLGDWPQGWAWIQAWL